MINCLFFVWVNRISSGWLLPSGRFPVLSDWVIGNEVMRKAVAPYGTNFIVSSGWLEFTGLLGGSSAFSPLPVRVQLGSCFIGTCKETGVCAFSKGFSGMVCFSTVMDSSGCCGLRSKA